MGSTAEVCWHNRQYLSAIERIALERPELSVALHDEVGVDVAIGALDVEIQIDWEVVSSDHLDGSPFGIPLHRSDYPEGLGKIPFGILLAGEPCVDDFNSLTRAHVRPITIHPLAIMGILMCQCAKPLGTSSCDANLS